MKKILIILFSLFVSVPVILPLFHTGYFPTHDGEWAVVRLGDMFRSLRDLQIPVRYSGDLNFNYGYPLFNFAYPFPYYLGIVLHFLGSGFVDAVKFIFAVSVLLSGLFMFLAGRLLWKNTWAGIVCAILYTYFPYRMVDLYVRGSIGESLSFVLFPLLFYLTIKLVNKFSIFSVCGIAISIAILIMTHNIMTVLFMPVYMSFIIGQIILKNKKSIKQLVAGIVLGLGMSAFFWIPALFEKNNILLSRMPIADRNLYFVTLNEFLLPRWGYGVPTDPNGFSYQLGLVHLAIFIVVILSLLFTFLKNKKEAKDNSRKIALLLTIISSFYTFLLFKPSDFLWKNIPLFSEINYPWTALGILGFLVSLLAGFLCKQYFGKYMIVFLAATAIFFVLPYAKPERYFSKADDYYLTNDATTTSSNELMPLWVKKFPFQRPSSKVEIIKGQGVIEGVFSNSKRVKFSVNTSYESIVRINTIYYPGWKVSVDKANIAISYSNEKGVMDISVPSGNHIVDAEFGETPLRLISDIISISSFFILLLFIIKRNKYAFS